MRHRFIWGLAALMNACTAEAAEKKQEGRPGALALETERGVAFTEQVPDSAVLGTFWAWSERGPALRAMRAEWREQEVEREERGTCTDSGRLVRATLGDVIPAQPEAGEVLLQAIRVVGALLPSA